MATTQPMTILDLLNLLGKFGGNLPAVLVFIQAIVKAWQDLQTAINPPASPAAAKLTAAAPLTTEEANACNGLAASHIAPGHVGALDGHRIIALIAFIKANPELLATLTQLLPVILAMFGKPAA